MLFEITVVELHFRNITDIRSSFVTHQGEVIWVDPDDAEVGVHRVLAGHLFQDLKELVTI